MNDDKELFVEAQGTIISFMHTQTLVRVVEIVKAEKYSKLLVQQRLNEGSVYENAYNDACDEIIARLEQEINKTS